MNFIIFHSEKNYIISVVCIFRSLSFRSLSLRSLSWHPFKGIPKKSWMKTILNIYWKFFRKKTTLYKELLLLHILFKTKRGVMSDFQQYPSILYLINHNQRYPHATLNIEGEYQGPLGWTTHWMGIPGPFGWLPHWRGIPRSPWMNPYIEGKYQGPLGWTHTLKGNTRAPLDEPHIEGKYQGPFGWTPHWREIPGSPWMNPHIEGQYQGPLG